MRRGNFRVAMKQSCGSQKQTSTSFISTIRVPQKWQNKKSYRGENTDVTVTVKTPADIWLFRNVKHNHEEQTIHPHPEDMIARILLATTDPEDRVFDPYMGAGTVAVVAQILGGIS